METSSISSWHIEGGKVEAVTDFIFLGSKITADSHCSHAILRQLLPERKAMTNLDSVLKSRDITLLTKAPIVKTIVFPAVMYICERWTIKNSKLQNRCFQTVVGEDSWESLGLQGDPTSQSWRKSVLNIYWKDWCWSWRCSTLATWWEGLINFKRPWCRERLRAKVRRRQQRMKWDD